MAIILDLYEQGSCSLEEYIHYLEDNVDFDCKDSILESAGMMRKLVNDTSWYVSRLNDSIISHGKNEHPLSGFYTSQTDVIYTGERFFLRTNAWLPSNDNQRLKVESRIFGEEWPHDHSFDILTAGLVGSGYTTKLYRYNKKNVIGYVGESVDIEFTGVCRLEKNRLLFMEKNVDIHSQIAPKELSVSFNLMMPAQVHSKQYLFDIKTNSQASITNIISDSDVGKTKVVDMIAEVGDQNSLDLIIEKLKKLSSSEIQHSESMIIALARAAAKLGATRTDFDCLKSCNIGVRKNLEFILLEDSL